MTAEEVSRNYHISMEKIRYYEENGLLEHSVLPDGRIEYSEQQIRPAGVIHALIISGLDMEKIKKFMKLFYGKGSDKKEQIQILWKQVFHCWMKSIKNSSHWMNWTI